MRRPVARHAPTSAQLELCFEESARPAVGAPAFLDRLRALGLRGIRSCTLTANRTTMVSFRADRLRVQRTFLDAPLAVLRAVVDFVNGTRAARRRARRTLLTFAPPPSATTTRQRRGPEASHPEDAPLVERLRAEHRRLNQEHFAGALPEVTIRVSRRMRARLGHYAPGLGGGAPEIAVARRHLRRDGWNAALETLKHEMIHQWQHATARPIAHDRDFRRKAREIGIDGRARRVLRARAHDDGGTSTSLRPS